MENISKEVESNDIKIDNLHAEKIKNNLANYYLSTKNKV